MNRLLKKATTFKPLLLSMSAGGLLLISAQAVSQICDTSLLASSPTHSFSIGPLGTALDRKTNLEWKVCAEGSTWSSGECAGDPSYHNWQQALDRPNALNASEGYAGKFDWRLPNIKELATIIEHRCSFPSINQAVFFEYADNDDDFYLDELIYWSSSPLKGLATSSWIVNFARAGLGVEVRSRLHRVRLVRTAPKAP